MSFVPAPPVVTAPLGEPPPAEEAPARVLLVEDDRRLGRLLAELLTGQGLLVETVHDGQAGLHAGLTRSYDVLVIDRVLPGIEGVDLISRLRSRGVVTPVLVLTARGALGDRVEGLDAGAEDYLVKPFEVPELLARLRALLRRHTDHADWLSLGRRRLDVAGRRVVDPAAGPDAAGRDVAGREVAVTERECALLEMLAARPSRVFTRAELLDRVFDADTPGAVDTYVSYLRRKLGRDVIHTVHGVGYRLGSA